jgi:citrate/tricarballylate utilization protein
VATVYHYFLGLHAPYALNSLPVILGALGGVGLVVGSIGLLYLNLQRDPAHGDQTQSPMDRAFIVLLLLISVSGLGLLIYRDTVYMSIWLVIHLGFVMGLFLTMPYGKFAHGLYRAAALLKNAIEKRQKNPLQLGSD